MFEQLWKNYHRRTRVGIEPTTSWLEIWSSWLDLERTYGYTKLQRLSLEHLQPKQKSYNWNDLKINRDLETRDTRVARVQMVYYTSPGVCVSLDAPID